MFFRNLDADVFAFLLGNQLRLSQPKKLMATALSTWAQLLIKAKEITLPSPEALLVSTTLSSSFGSRSTASTFCMLGVCGNGRPH